MCPTGARKQVKVKLDMATVYKVNVVSHWINYPKEDLQKLLEKAVKTIEVNGNEIQIEVIERK